MATCCTRLLFSCTSFVFFLLCFGISFLSFTNTFAFSIDFFRFSTTFIFTLVFSDFLRLNFPPKIYNHNRQRQKKTYIRFYFFTPGLNIFVKIRQLCFAKIFISCFPIAQHSKQNETLFYRKQIRVRFTDWLCLSISMLAENFH